MSEELSKVPEEDKESLSQLQDKNNEDEEEDVSCDEKTLNENIQGYLDIDEQEEKLETYKAMIKEVNTKMQIKDERDYRINYILKKLVSCQKRRYIQDGFDLDLTYITTNIIAMGYPCSSLDQMYRNSMGEVQRFFKLRHPGHHKVYNLCSERQYNPNSFDCVNAEFTWPDHNPPPFKFMEPFCRDVHTFLGEDKNNVVAIHCKAGKGRTGIMISAYMLYCKMFAKAADALIYYGYSRTKNGKGLTIPSQIRYVYYFEHLLSRGLTVMPTKRGKIVKIRMITVPMINMTGGCEPHYRITCGGLDYYTKQDVRPQALSSSDSIYELKLPKPVEVVDDVLVECYNKGLMGKGEKIFQFWFNVSFVNEDGVLRINKRMLDKAYHDKANKKFNKNFRVEVEMVFGDCGTGGGMTQEPEPELICRLIKLSEDMPLNYRKLPLV